MDELIQLQGGTTGEERSSDRITAFHKEHPTGSAYRMRIGAKGAAAKRGKKLTPQCYARRQSPEVKERVRHSSSMHGLPALGDDGEAQPWVRWSAQRMVALDLDRMTLAKELRCDRKTVGNLLSGRCVPKPDTVQSLEAVFGSMPIEVTRAIKNARSARAGGNTSQRRLRARAEKWTYETLKTKISELGGPAPSRDLRALLVELPWNEPLGKRAYDIYHVARAEAMRHKGRPAKPFWESKVSPLGRPLTPHGKLKQALGGLERRDKSWFFQCQACRQLWATSRGKVGSGLCGPCWKDDYQPKLSSWLLHQQGAPPALPRRKGGKLADPDDLQERVVAFLRYRVLGERPPIDEANAHRTLSRTQSLLENSQHPWCQRVIQLLADLA